MRSAIYILLLLIMPGNGIGHGFVVQDKILPIPKDD